MQKITISYLAPSRRDINAHFELLKPAFNGSHDPKSEWLDVVEKVQTGQASLYLIKAKDVQIRFVGRVIDGIYHVICSQGRGLAHAAPVIIERCLSMGYPAISYHAYRPGMGRLLRGFGFELDSVPAPGESRYVLNLEGYKHG
ncbi:hypothetical protein [Vibrio gazogenes]|nr:hypothetical protein [Vibrio gazogenes]